jgi:3-dehydroshikimate dehydratase
MKLSIASATLGGGFAEKLEAAAAAGFKGIEIFGGDLLSFEGTPQDVKTQAAKLGLEVVAYQPAHDFERVSAAGRERVLARAEREFMLTKALGCPLLVVCMNVSADGREDLDGTAAELAELATRAAAHRLTIGFKALAPAPQIIDLAKASDVVRRANHPAIGLVLDSVLALASERGVDAVKALSGTRIVLVHLADAPAGVPDVQAVGRHLTSFPGQGDLPLVAFMAALQYAGFDGPLALATSNDQFRAAPSRRVALDGYRSLLFLFDEVRAKSGRAILDLPALPKRSQCYGIEFIEFALDKMTAPRFEALLRGLGFVLAGRHRSKAVTRWTQGAINVVVNTDTAGFAHSYNITHGTSVCALGLMVDDAAATLERAKLLLDQPFWQKVAPGELEIPAIRGVGGSLIYFVDRKSNLARVWDVEFAPNLAPDTSGGAGLARVDHISQSVHFEELPTWLLFYTSLIELSKLPEREVLDPGGLVKSLVIQDAVGAVRLVLNASQSKHVLMNRFLWEAFGAGVQHIAFATDDIVATAKKLIASGVALLRVPENYYADLAINSDLPAERIAAFKACNILYDRESNGGEFLQIYTETFEQGFFIEIVERRNYSGFGATNAPVRLAAQSRKVKSPALPYA